MNSKLLYKYLLRKNKIKSNVEELLPDVTWEIILKSLNSFNNPIDRNILYRYINGIIPTGQYLVKFQIVNDVPKCTTCNNGLYTKQHIFILCSAFLQDRLELKRKIKKIDSSYNFNKTFYMCGLNPNHKQIITNKD